VARNLSDLTITAPASDPNPAVGGSFTFTVTPSFGGAGVNPHQVTDNGEPIAAPGARGDRGSCGLCERHIQVNRLETALCTYKVWIRDYSGMLTGSCMQSGADLYGEACTPREVKRGQWHCQQCGRRHVEIRPGVWELAAPSHEARRKAPRSHKSRHT
jgi:hypothetical protein